LGLKDKKKMSAIVQKVQDKQMNVRQLEQLIQRTNENVPRETSKRKKIQKSAVIKQKEAVLRERLGTAVEIQQSKRKGTIEISFYSNDDLNRVLEILEGDSNDDEN